MIYLNNASHSDFFVSIPQRLIAVVRRAMIALPALLLTSPLVCFAQADLSPRTFYGSFTRTLVPEIATMPTFARMAGSSNGKVKDVFGAWQDAFPGEARFVGANRVANLIPDSETFGTAQWWTDPNAASYVTKGNALATPNPLTPGRTPSSRSPARRHPRGHY